MRGDKALDHVTRDGVRARHAQSGEPQSPAATWPRHGALRSLEVGRGSLRGSSNEKATTRSRRKLVPSLCLGQYLGQWLL